ncbi:glutamine--fructose-6-phosphate transaminase (isomerizing) [Stomatobaculum longum]|uniref:glutamine--fructose-6-phosphate transaminase (isomerizing) n=1 Tax=Stomatobaculum longum TaxID=796942 RepID=UPI0028E8D7FC|nr:glutamine--fructose-6-phosphate transaminase (isomerizing) [Stomatobaculum longum]
MCGIVGYVGSRQAAPILLEGLEKLEYRGYDSAGIAVRDGDKEPVVVKAKGRLRVLADKTDNGHALKGCCGIGHTRWATHGVPSETNAHPHVSTDGSVLAVHNGIFENYLEIREKLARHNYRFYSQTDTEAIVNLIDYYYKKYKMGPIDAIAKTLVRVRGSYALAIMFRDYPEQVYIARKDNPLIVGLGEGENFIASDPSACLKYTRRVCYIDNFEMGCVTKDSATFYDLNGDVVEKTPVLIDWDETAAEKGGYEHFMMKEIHEQPKAIADTFRAYLSDETDGKKLDYRVDLAKLGLTDELIQSLSGVTIIGCGSAYHVGATAQYVIEDLAKLPVRVEFASEYRYRHPIIDSNNLVVVISQSGETADTLAAMREAKEQGLKTLAIVNVIGSVIAREADFVLYTYAGPEISVATTKAYSTQLIGVYLLAICLGKARGLIDEREEQRLLAEIAALPEKVQRIIDDKERLQWFAAKFSNAKDVFFIGRGIDYAICMEGSLKMKEISYIHSEAYAAGELKHGTISLIEDGTLVIGVLTQSELYEKTLSNLVEVKSRGAYLMGLTTSGNYDIEDTVNFAFFLPKTDEHFADSLAVVPLQLLGYYLAVSKGLDVDKPRNLAKSVTVE